MSSDVNNACASHFHYTVIGLVWIIGLLKGASRLLIGEPLILELVRTAWSQLPPTTSY